MLFTIWNGSAKPKDGKRKNTILRTGQNSYPRSYALDEEPDEEELPDELSEISDEPETPLRHHVAMRYDYFLEP